MTAQPEATRGRMKIGVIMPVSENSETQYVARYPEIRARALQAEAAGFDSIWVYDHLLYRMPDQPPFGIWESWTILSALAEATSRVELGAIVMCTAFRNPAVLAKMATTLDEVSAGRLILGLGAGWHEPEFQAFGFPFDHLVSRFEESLEIIVPLLREGQVDFEGTYNRAPNCELRPRGPRASGPPILIGSFGPRTMRLTARHADSWNTCWLGQPTLLPERRAALEAACAEVGRDPATLEVTVGVRIAYLKPGETSPEPLDPDKILFGSVDEVAAAMRAHADHGVKHLICFIDPMTEESFAWLAEVMETYRRAEEQG